MKLGTEFQSRSYDAMVSHTTIVFTRYILLEWIRRNQNDQKTYGELFFMFCDDIQDMNLTNALQGLMSLFTNIVSMMPSNITEMLKSIVNNWMTSQPLSIQALFGDLYWESCVCYIHFTAQMVFLHEIWLLYCEKFLFLNAGMFTTVQPAPFAKALSVPLSSPAPQASSRFPLPHLQTQHGLLHLEYILLSHPCHKPDIHTTLFLQKQSLRDLTRLHIFKYNVSSQIHQNGAAPKSDAHTVHSSQHLFASFGHDTHKTARTSSLVAP